MSEEGLAGLSLKALLLTTIAILLFGIYIGTLMYGENSLAVWKRLREEKRMLTQQKAYLMRENQKLQKEYFELKQLQAKE